MEMHQPGLSGLLCEIPPPVALDRELILQCRNYHEAVQLCFEKRRIRNMTRRMLAERAELNPSHVTQYLSDGKRHVRELPGWGVQGFEWACGNTAISQWHAMRAQLTVVEEVPALRALLNLKAAA